MRDEIERAPQRMGRVRRMRSGQHERVAGEHGDRDERQQHQDRERGAKTGVVDNEADDQRARDRRGRIAESEQTEVAHARRRPAHFAGRVLDRHLERHERDADQEGGQEKRRYAGHDERQRSAQRDPARSHEHRAPYADAVGQPPGRNREHHRQHRIQREQHADGCRVGALRQRVERHRDARTRQHHVVGDADSDQHPERRDREAAAPAHGARRSIVQASAARRYAMRSCSLDARPCQNSNRSGRSR